jgi:hypothetical protein
MTCVDGVPAVSWHWVFAPVVHVLGGADVGNVLGRIFGGMRDGPALRPSRDNHNQREKKRTDSAGNNISMLCGEYGKGQIRGEIGSAQYLTIIEIRIDRKT